jgi:hypothetical protein
MEHDPTPSVCLGRLRSIAAIVLCLTAAACSTSTSSGPSASAVAPSATASVPTPTPSASAVASPHPSLPADLGPAPTIDYPDSQALGVGTMTLTAPVVAPAHFWVTCEWSTTAQVAWLYPKPVTVLGESVYPNLSATSAPSFWLGREGQVASYFPTDASRESVEHNADWSTATITFAGLPLNPELWSGPFPTPKASFERPLGGDPNARTIDGSVAWACGPRPATVPATAPFETEEPRPSLPFDQLPDATIHVGDEERIGKPGCGVSWEGYGSSGFDSCGPSYQVLGDDAAVRGSVGDRLRFSLPAGFRFTQWSMAWVDQATAEHYRGVAPPKPMSRPGAHGIDEATLSLAGLPAGDWSVLLSWSGTDGKLTVTGQPDYFRVIIR